jgi:hypothetical protein
MKNLLITLSLAALVAMSAVSCKKEQDPTAQAIAEDLSTHLDLAFQAAFEADVAASFNVSGYPNYGDCPQMTFDKDQGTWPNSITLDYSQTGCGKSDSRIFKGKIQVAQTKKMTLIGARQSLTFDRFYINNAQVSGSVVLTYKGLAQGSGKFLFTMVNDQTITYPDGSKSTCKDSLDLIALNTFTFFTDPYNSAGWNMTGSASGVSRKGNAFTANISQIQKTGSCAWIHSGDMQLTFDKTTRSLTYSETCKDNATIQADNGGNKSIRVHKWWE